MHDILNTLPQRSILMAFMNFFFSIFRVVEIYEKACRLKAFLHPELALSGNLESHHVTMEGIIPVFLYATLSPPDQCILWLVDKLVHMDK